jgi:hypothetical protein
LCNQMIKEIPNLAIRKFVIIIFFRNLQNDKIA